MGTTGGVSESVGVDSRLRSIVVDIGGEGCIVGGLVTSVSPFAATMVAVALSMGRSVAAHTAMRSTLLLWLRSLLLLSELGVRSLALDSTQLVSLGMITPCSNKKMVRHVRHVHMHTGTDCYEWLTKTCKWGVDVDERTLRKDKRKTYLCQ